MASASGGVKMAQVLEEHASFSIVHRRRGLLMPLQFGVSLPQGGFMELASLKDPVEAYEAMTRVAQTADEIGFDSAWLVDHFHTVPHPSQEVTFESWTTT